MSNDDVDDNNINNQLSNVEVMNASDDNDDDRIDDVISSKGEDCYKLWKITRHW